MNASAIIETPPLDSIPRRFAEVAARHANRVAISFPEQNWSYAELDQRSAAYAGLVIERSKSDAEAVVALLLPHGPPLIAAVLGVLRSGRMYLALDPAEPRPRLQAMLTDSQAKLLLTDRSHLPVARSLATNAATILELDDDPRVTFRPRDLPDVSPEAGAWLVYTSGSTGTPKGVWQDHRGVMHHATVYHDLVGITAQDRLSLLTPLHLAASATHLFTALLNGASLCPLALRASGSGQLLDWMAEQRVSVLHTVPTVFRQLVRRSPKSSAIADLRLIRLGGEAVLPNDVELFRQLDSDPCVLMHALSSTETGLICASLIDSGTLLPTGRVPVGRPVGDAIVSLIPEPNTLREEANEGRISVNSAYLARGYWRRPEATAEAFRSDPKDPSRRIFLTGDLGRVRADGQWEHLGRMDQQVKVRGHRVDLGEVESALRSLEGVDDAAVVPHDAPDGGKRLVAYVVAPGADRGNRQARLRELLPSPLQPSEFVWLDQLPQTAGGKLDRRALPAPPSRSGIKAAPPGGPKPRDGIERKVARVWESVLGISKLSRHEDVFALGANSLQATEALLGLEETFGVALSPGDLVEHRTVESLAELVAEHALVRSPRCLVKLRSAESGRPLFLVHSGHGDVATYAQLARRLPGRPIYGLQAVGMQGEAWPLMTIRSMAQRYLPEIIGADPTGPYLLGGTCMGGLVAFEMACLLVEQGRDVGFLGLIDSTAPPFGGKRSPWIEMLLDPVRDSLRIARWAVLRMLGQGRRGPSLPAYRHFIGSITSRARYYYRPRRYPGTITLFLTSDAHFPRGDRRLLMAKHAKESQTIVIPGRREELFLRPAVDELARQLRAQLDQAVDRVLAGG